jgi:hypothetical protein
MTIAELLGRHKLDWGFCAYNRPGAQRDNGAPFERRSEKKRRKRKKIETSGGPQAAFCFLRGHGVHKIQGLEVVPQTARSGGIRGTPC